MSLFEVSFFVVSVAAGGVVILVVSFFVESLLLAFLEELQPAAIEPIIAAISTKFKICFFIGSYIFYLIQVLTLYLQHCL